MTAEMDSSLVSQCLAFCQTLASQGKAFNFKLTNTPFSFTSDTKGINVKSTVDKKRISPSTQRRNTRRREEFLKRSSTLSHLHHLNLKDNFSSDIVNSFFMDVLSPFCRGRWLPPTQYLSSPRAERARAFTGRQCPHSGKGEDFLTGQPDFFTETAVTPERKVEKSFPRWEINRHGEG